jgi:DMSO/TMAO reductase YedYZ molybdopterin-dependent catalytic subunit
MLQYRAKYRAGSFSRSPLAPQRMQERLTPTQDLFVLCHLGVPQLEADSWSLTIDGLVARPLRLGFSDLTTYPESTITSFYQCCGSPLRPFEPTRRIANVRWSGARLSDIMRDCRPASEAKYLWSYGADYAEFVGMYHEAYVKDLPLERISSDVLIAYELNGAPLPIENGFPARLVVPGFYSTNSVKWLTRMTVAKTRATGAFTTRWYNDPVLNAAGEDSGETVPVWSIAPGIHHCLTGTRPSNPARYTATDLGMGMGRRWNRPGRCQRRRRRDVDGGAGGTSHGASVAAVRTLLACQRPWGGRAVLQGPRTRRRNSARVRTQKRHPPDRSESGLNGRTIDSRSERGRSLFEESVIRRFRSQGACDEHINPQTTCHCPDLARANSARLRRRVRSVQLRSRHQAAHQKGARCPDVARGPRERNRVHDDLLLGKRRRHAQVHRRRSQKSSSSRTG